jgi:hypothetical protein
VIDPAADACADAGVRYRNRAAHARRIIGARGPARQPARLVTAARGGRTPPQDRVPTGPGTPSHKGELH